MRPAENIEKLIKNINIDTNADVDKTVLNDVLKAFGKSKITKSAITPPSIWRIIIKSKITKLAAAAVIIIAVVGLLIFFEKSVTPAYSIEQTIKACQDARFKHFEYFGSSGERMKEAWLEYDDSGQIKNIRVNFSKVGGGDDVVMVWKQGRTQQWSKQSKRLTLFDDRIYTDKIIFFVQRYDPARAVENIQKMEKEGKVEINIDEPSNKIDPIILTAIYEPNTFLLEGPMPQMKEIFFIDQSTKLVKAIEIYELKDDQYLELGVWKYPDYDTTFDAKIFNLEDEVPSDVNVIDWRALDIGLEQGDLTDEQVAIKIVQEFFKALIAKDYATATKLLYHEDPKEEPEIQKKIKNINVLRIISIDKTFPPPPDKSKKVLGVSRILEIGKDGQIIRWEPNNIFVSRVLGHPNRLIINSFKYP